MSKGFCGCCGRETINPLWCIDCAGHVLPNSPGRQRPPWNRTITAQFGYPCPYEPKITYDSPDDAKFEPKTDKEWLRWLASSDETLEDLYERTEGQS